MKYQPFFLLFASLAISASFIDLGTINNTESTSYVRVPLSAFKVQQATQPIEEFRRYAQYAALSSYCMAYKSPCLHDYPVCLDMLSEALLSKKPVENSSAVFPRETTDIYRFSTYAKNNSDGSEGAFIIETKAHSSQTLVVAFAGSKKLEDWLNDFNVWKTDFVPIVPTDLFASNDTQIHTGFSDIYTLVRPTLIDLMTSILAKYRSIKEIVFTGHSLGGVLASLFLLDVRQCQIAILKGKSCPLNVDNLLPMKLYTYGQPRFGNWNMMLYFDQVMKAFPMNPVKISRNVNEHDIVPRLPTVAMGYQHIIGPYYMVLQDETRHDCDTRTTYDKTAACTSIKLPTNGHTKYFLDFDLVKTQCAKKKI